MKKIDNRVLEAVLHELLEHVPNKKSGVVRQEFWEAIDPMDYRERDEALSALQEQHRIDIFPQGEGERAMIAVRPARVRCPDCRQWRPGSEDWDEHIDDCLRQRERLRKLGLLYQWKLAEPKGGRHV